MAHHRQPQTAIAPATAFADCDEPRTDDCLLRETTAQVEPPQVEVLPPATPVQAPFPVEDLLRRIADSLQRARPTPEEIETLPTPSLRVPKGTFHISLEELRRKLREREVVVDGDGLRTEGGQPPPPDQPAVKVPKGTFHISLEELRRKLREREVVVDGDGIRTDDGQPPEEDRPAVRVPKGTFHSGVFQRLGAFFSGQDQLAEFARVAPRAQYVGEFDGQHTWTEWVRDPVTGVAVQLAYTTGDRGATAEAWCLDPPMDGHGEDMHLTHCYGNGRLCTDLHGVQRTLVEKRARAILWVTGFCQYLQTGNFAIDQ